MATFTNRFPFWGKTGETPPNGFQYDGGDQVNEKHLNYIWDAIQKQTDEIIANFDSIEAQLDAIDSNGDGVVDAADYANDADASTYKNNDIDTNGDGVVNQADVAQDANQLGGQQPVFYNQKNAPIPHPEHCQYDVPGGYDDFDSGPYSVTFSAAEGAAYKDTGARITVDVTGRVGVRSRVDVGVDAEDTTNVDVKWVAQGTADDFETFTDVDTSFAFPVKRYLPVTEVTGTQTWELHVAHDTASETTVTVSDFNAKLNFTVGENLV